MKNLNKKGILLPETLKILIAVLSIGILIYLAASLFGIFRQQTKLEQAKATLEEIVGKIQEFDLQNIKEGEVLVFNPIDWVIKGFSTGNPNFPVSCNGKSCLCICESGPTCDVMGVCKEVTNLVHIGTLFDEGRGYIKISSSMKIFFKKEDVHFRWIMSDKEERIIKLIELDSYLDSEIILEEGVEWSVRNMILSLPGQNDKIKNKYLDLLEAKAKEMFNPTLGENKWEIVIMYTSLEGKREMLLNFNANVNPPESIITDMGNNFWVTFLYTP